MLNSIPLPEKFDGKLKINTLLNDAKLLLKNKVLGPESLALGPNGDLFTGNSDGIIYLIRNDKLSIFTKLEGVRPLGLRYHKNGYIYVMADLGLYQIYLNKTVVKVFGIEDMKFSDKTIKSSKFLDDLVVMEGIGHENGDVIYFSDVSIKFPLHYWFYAYFEPDSNGRIVKYDVNSKEFTVTLAELWFPNGIEVNDDKNALLVCELTKRRILKHFIRGPKEGKTEVLIDRLPAEPDNIRRSLSPKETYWIGMVFARNASNYMISDRMSEFPLIRKLLIRSTYLLGSILSYFGCTFNYEPLTEFGNNLMTGLSLALPALQQLPGMAIEIDSNGAIVTTLQSPDNKFSGISEVREVSHKNNERILYIGSAFNPYLGKLVIK
jgi:hypothetical protein